MIINRLCAIVLAVETDRRGEEKLFEVVVVPTTHVPRLFAKINRIERIEKIVQVSFDEASVVTRVDYVLRVMLRCAGVRPR